MSDIELLDVPDTKKSEQEDQPVSKSTQLEVLPSEMETGNDEEKQKLVEPKRKESIRKSTINLDLPDAEGRKRRIDYVLAHAINVDGDDQEEIKERYRNLYFENLKKKGLVLETEEEGDVKFVKVHVPYDVLFHQAEKMKMKLPLKWNDTETPSGLLPNFLDISQMLNPPLFDEDDDANTELG